MPSCQVNIQHYQYEGICSPNVLQEEKTLLLWFSSIPWNSRLNICPPLSHRILFVFDSFYAFIISLIDRFTGWTNCLFVVKRRTIHFRKNCLPCQERSEGCLPVKNRLVSYWKRFTTDALTIQKVCVLFYDTWQIYIQWQSDYKEWDIIICNIFLQLLL